MYVKGSLDKCIRLMVLYNSIINQKEVKHIYLRDAKILRPDLSNMPKPPREVVIIL